MSTVGSEMFCNKKTLLLSTLLILKGCVSFVYGLPELMSPLGPVINLGYAAFAGNSTSPSGELNSSVIFFGGIPYAQPPLGDLRFRAPKELNENIVNSGNVKITDARNWGPPCIQQPAVVGVGSEDCLQLNIWKPTDAKEGDKLPVFFYIHGGGTVWGTPQGFPMYDWVNQSNPKIIAVSVAYRLNVLGFLSSAEMRKEGPVNAGLLDQRAALEWIQRHISKFGGDPGEVTIAGESAGGASVMMQVVSYGGSKLVPFKRAIVQSPGYGPTATAENAERLFNNVTTIVGCPSSGPQTMPCLRSASVGAIVAAINYVPFRSVTPVVDGPSGFLPDLPATLIRSGKFSKVDYIGGHCSNDGRTWVNGTPSQFVTDEDIVTRVFARWEPYVSEELKQEALALYPAPGTPGSPFTSQYDRAATMTQEISYACADWFLADRMQAGGSNSVFAYRFNAPDPVLLAAAPYLGVMHTSDLYFLFDGTNTEPNAGYTFTAFNETEAPLSQEAIAFWTSFASSGNPSTSKKAFSPTWTTLSSGRRMVMTRGTNSSGTASAMEVIPADEIARCNFWMSVNVTAQTRL